MAGQTQITVQSDSSGTPVNTLPACGQDAPAGSLPVVLDSAVETAVGTAGTRAITVQGASGGVALPIAAAALPLPAGAGKDATLVQIDTDLNAGLGTDGSSPPTLPGGATGVRGWLRYLASLLPASLGPKASAASLAVVLASDQAAVPVTAGNLPATVGAKASAASLSVAPATDAVFKVAQPDAATNGTIPAATASATFAVALAGGEGVVGFALSGLAASGATLTAEAANDGGTNWAPINLVAPGSGALTTTATADGNYRVNAGGHTNVRLRVTTVGTGTITVAALASSQNPLIAVSSAVTLAANGLGSLTATPTGSANGTPLAAIPPAGKRGVRLYVQPGGSLTFTIASTQPTSAPSATITIANPSTNTTPMNWDEDLNGQNLYILSGSGLFRWY